MNYFSSFHSRKRTHGLATIMFGLMSASISIFLSELTLADGIDSSNVPYSNNLGSSDTGSNEKASSDQYFDTTTGEESAPESQKLKTDPSSLDSSSSNAQNPSSNMATNNGEIGKDSGTLQASGTAPQNLPTAEKKNPSVVKGAKASVSLATASSEQIAAAIGHYARARSLLIAAVREFDKGMVKADASPLLDTDSWRETMVSHAAELERILSPKPRESKTGVQFDPDPRLLGEATK